MTFYQMKMKPSEALTSGNKYRKFLELFKPWEKNMQFNMKKIWPAAAMSIVAMTAMLGAADKMDKGKCPKKSICGPDREINPSVYPITYDACCCEDEEFGITVAPFYWAAHEDGLEFGIYNNVANTQYQGTLIEANFLSPEFKWEFGVKAGLFYNSPHDGWDINFLWTHFHGKAKRNEEADTEDNVTLLALRSAYAVQNPQVAANDNGILFATEIDAYWKLKMDLIDLELGREFWTSKYLSIRPHIGLRGGWIDQTFELQHKGGSWGSVDGAAYTSPAVTNEIHYRNNFKGVGLRGGLDTMWHFNCNWGLYGRLAMALMYGRFEVDQDEDNRLATAPFSKTDIIDLEDSFHATRGIADLELGVAYTTLFKDEKYQFTIALGWEHHLFFNQNQMWRVTRIGDTTAGTPNISGANIYEQGRGDLSTQGATLTFKLTF